MSEAGSTASASPRTAFAESEDERRRIEEVYGRYRDNGREAARWDSEAPGNRCIIEERRRHVARLLAARPRPRRVLEVGCGRGAVMVELQTAFGPATTVHGLDLLHDRLLDARGLGLHPLQADGRHLPFGDGRFDLVVVYTVFSSILDGATRQAVAVEIQRVLAPSGAVLWYDMRFPSLNRSVRPLGRAAIQDLFPHLYPRLVSSTVLPPLARSLGRHDRSLYPWLHRLPATRSHLLGLLEPAPSAPSAARGAS